jgi:hypothetical protein
MVLIRREDPGGRLSKNEPIVGLSYGATAPDKMPLREYEARARRFLLFTLPAQAALIVMLYFKEALAQHVGSGAVDPDGANLMVLAGLAVYGWAVLAYAVAKTGESIGMGFWSSFAMTMFPPMLPAVVARIGGRSIMWVYLYLAIDVLVAAVSLRFFHAAPLFFLLTLAALVPLIIYHVSGCAIGTIATALGMNSYAAVLWICGLPLGLLVYEGIQQGIAEKMIHGLVDGEEGVGIDMFATLFDPTILADSATLTALILIWAIVGWIFWLKSVYESLRYPLF